jgi:hypothetical protein
MKKLLLLLVVLAVGLGAAVFYLDSLAKGAIEKGGTYAAGVETKVGSASIGLTNGTFTLADFTIANPPGYGSDPFFKLGKLETGVSLGTLNQELIEIPKLTIDGVALRLEAKDGKANYSVITDNLKRFSTASASSEQKSGKKFVIRELVIANVSVTADTSLLVPLPVGAKPEVKLPDIRMKDVGNAGGGASMGELAGVIVAAVLNGVGGASGFLNADFAKDLTGRVGDLGGLQQQAQAAMQGAVKQLDDALKNSGGELQKSVDGALKGVGDQLGGLLGGKK